MVDLWVVSHHGQPMSNSQVLVHAIRPRVAILNNGPRKGGANLLRCRSSFRLRAWKICGSCTSPNSSYETPSAHSRAPQLFPESNPPAFDRHVDCPSQQQRGWQVTFIKSNRQYTSHSRQGTRLEKTDDTGMRRPKKANAKVLTFSAPSAPDFQRTLNDGSCEELLVSKSVGFSWPRI